MKKKLVAISATVAVLCLGAIGCAPQTDMASTGEDASPKVEYSDDSVLAYHEALGQDLSFIEQPSATSCTSDTACHKGSWESVVESTEGMFAGFGQIPDANPHESHATNAFECGDCHSMTGSSVNQCNGCHNFDTPEGWTDKDPATTCYGIATEEPQY